TAGSIGGWSRRARMSALPNLPTSTLVIGDIHGQYDKLVLLLKNAGLIDERLRWSGSTNGLWLIGDLVDRGPAGINVVDLAMRLQQEAAAVGGSATTLLGNHAILPLAAYHFGDWPRKRHSDSFVAIWQRNGGRVEDLALLDAHQV